MWRFLALVGGSAVPMNSSDSHFPPTDLIRFRSGLQIVSFPALLMFLIFFGFDVGWAVFFKVNLYPAASSPQTELFRDAYGL